MITMVCMLNVGCSKHQDSDRDVDSVSVLSVSEKAALAEFNHALSSKQN